PAGDQGKARPGRSSLRRAAGRSPGARPGERGVRRRRPAFRPLMRSGAARGSFGEEGLAAANGGRARDKTGTELGRRTMDGTGHRSEEHTSELQSRENLVCRLLLEKKKKTKTTH